MGESRSLDMVGTRWLDMDIWYRHPRRTCQAFSCLIFRSRTLDKGRKTARIVS
uniref:Cyclin dependent kinase inhibitor n=1 Tax=Solanum tuberosum TaxID=4113 RepID=M1ACS3_SOLTU